MTIQQQQQLLLLMPMLLLHHLLKRHDGVLKGAVRAQLKEVTDDCEGRRVRCMRARVCVCACAIERACVSACLCERVRVYFTNKLYTYQLSRTTWR